MKKYHGIKTLVLFTGLSLVFSSIAFADQKDNIILAQKSDAKDQKAKESTSQLFVYKPPMRGKPGNRVGGGTRGFDSDMPVVAALVPDHTGLTTMGQPILYWYLSQPTKHNIEFTLNDDHSIDPIIEVKLKNANTKGIHSIRLSDYNITLLQGIEYQWFVTVVRDPEQRSKDIIATGTIRRVEFSRGLNEELTRAGKKEVPSVYAEQGIWYDTLSSLSELINANPDDKGLVEKRTSLLQQIGLSEVVGK